MAEYTASVITVSDKGYNGEREDVSGAVTARLLEEHGFCVVGKTIVPDEMAQISAALRLECDKNVALVVTTGGTGFSVRDVTPEATNAVIERRADGIAEAIRAYSLTITPKAMLSRGVSGIRGKSLIVNLPGSPKAVSESLNYVLDSLKHGIDILWGNASECARKD